MSFCGILLSPDFTGLETDAAISAGRLLDLYREAMQLEIAFFDAHMPQRSAES